ncbi:serine hydrolase [Caulobacter segnis]|uniref:serine hydrolase domain-containing protein n=1 Tax=Caulobacter segnis TaxID=88688 RepID=UPI00240F75A8|nr:serine hydrolase domain-containing protein [Caulobacter segnis]MDG2521220.1 serine hydrolase [Caulobacter segnis]
METLLASLTSREGPGAALAVRRLDGATWRGFQGLADLENRVPIGPSTRFHVASVSKQFTAYAALRLAAAGRLDMDGELGAYLPELPEFDQAISLSQMAWHVSGLKDQWALLTLGGRDWGDVLNQARILRLVARVPELDFAPGSAYAYSNTNYTLLAEIVQRVSGAPFWRHMRDEVFAPRGMSNTVVYDDVTAVLTSRAQSYTADGQGGWKRSILSYANFGATSVHTTVDDLLTWGGYLLRPPAADQALASQMLAQGRLNDGAAIAYGHGLIHDQLGGHEAFVHSGNDAAFNAYFAIVPAAGLCVAVTANTRMDVRKLADEMVRIVAGAGEHQPRRTTRSSASAGELAGVYVGGAMGQCLFVVDTPPGVERRLAPGVSGTPLTAVDGELVRLDADVRLRPRRDAGGAVTGLEETDASNPFHPTKTLWRRVGASAPKPARLQQLVGEWRSGPLDITYRLDVVDGQLVISDLWGARRVILLATDQDRFDGADGVLRTLQIIRGADGDVDHITLSTGRARGLRFDRAA